MSTIIKIDGNDSLDAQRDMDDKCHIRDIMEAQVLGGGDPYGLGKDRSGGFDIMNIAMCGQQGLGKYGQPLAATCKQCLKVWLKERIKYPAKHKFRLIMHRIMLGRKGQSTIFEQTEDALRKRLKKIGGNLF